MDATSFVVAGEEKNLTEHLENVRFVIRNKFISFYTYGKYILNIYLFLIHV